MTVTVLNTDVLDGLRSLPADHFGVVVTSPPYWGLRDYGVPGQLGLEPTLGEHLERMVGVFAEVHRVLKPDGVLWVNYGDCYATAPNGRSAGDTKAAGGDDRTFSDVSAFGSDAWCAEKLGQSRDWFRRMRPDLEVIGFPVRDRITGLTIKADVEAWIARRRSLLM